MDVPAHTESAQRRLVVGIAAMLAALATLFAASPAMAEEVVVEEVLTAPAESEAQDPAAAAPSGEPGPATPAVDPAALSPAEETTPVEELLTLLPATEAGEAVTEPDPLLVAVTPEVIVNEPASPSPAAPVVSTPAAATPPNAAPDAPNVAVAPSRPDPVARSSRPYASPIVPPATLDAPEPPPDAVPAGVVTSKRLKLSDSGLGPTIDRLTKDWTKHAASSASEDGAEVQISSTPFVEQITDVPAYVAPSAAGGFLQLLVAWVAPGDLGGAAALAPLTQLLFVLVAWMLVRPRPLRETLSRFSADRRIGYRAVVLRPG
ncbi:MAG: hypothetical protein OEM67_06865 [Thermoleophilia bacterium]|nr:hypothetical protein [Thermoleophilia bacterium]MDH3725468.1 hypothetical protein [Thermoleophilia bacterium]